jgi:hypothetical protein
MATKTLPSIDLLRQLLLYHSDTGSLYWRYRMPDMFKNGVKGQEASCITWNKRYANTLAGNLNENGYINIIINKKMFYAHRIIWKLYYGEEPKNLIDHINGNKADNRITNLREATYSQNQINRIKYNNKSGMRGVVWNNTCQKWQSSIMSKGLQIYLGVYDCPAAAHFVYQVASDKYHGEFSRFR